MTPQLRPCPFCGGPARYLFSGETEDVIEVTGCDACRIWVHGPDASERWNRRAEQR